MRIHTTGLSVVVSVAIAALCGLPDDVRAQVLNPTSAEFEPSSDHHTLTSDGTPLVSGYQLQFFQQGAVSPFQTSPVGKPAPAGDGLIRVSLSTITTPSAGIVYEARVAAVGPGGTSPSATSNTFMFTNPCTYTVAPLTASVAAGGGTGTASVSASAGCAWVATSSASSWLTITSGTSGSGNGSVAYRAAANTAQTARTGVLTIAGRTVSVTQGAAAASCPVTLSPASQTVAHDAASGSIAVSVAAGCAWTAASNATWLTMTSGVSGTGSGTVTFRPERNTTSAARTATITVGGSVATISQMAGIGPRAPQGFRVIATP